MNLQDIINFIIDFSHSKLEERGIEEKLNEESFLVGADSLLDSMDLVELCLSIEDLAEENNFSFDWTSEEAMSKSKSMFRSPTTLASNYISQFEDSK
jgi:acyl carrier protein